MSEKEAHKCSGECGAELPPGTDVPEGWTVIRVEKFGKKKVQRYYLYACPACTVTVTKKQASLFGNQEST